MHLLTLIFGIVLLPKATTLRCYECALGTDPTTCSTVKQCPLEDQQCGALRIVSYAGGSKNVDFNMKSCASAQECVQASINYGIAKTTISTKCCTSELCNSQPAPEISSSRPNGRKCFTCNGQTCTATLNCEGNENYCISSQVSANGETVTLKGCVSELVCLSASVTQLAGAIQGEMNCCQGDYCNSASSTSAGLLLLLAPLLSFVVFS